MLVYAAPLQIILGQRWEVYLYAINVKVFIHWALSIP